jgi:hypothetical protein
LKKNRWTIVENLSSGVQPVGGKGAGGREEVNMYMLKSVDDK